MTMIMAELNKKMVGRRVSVEMGDGDRKTGTITEIFESGVIGSKGTQFDMRPIYGETAGINYDKPYGGWGEVSTLRIEFI